MERPTGAFIRRASTLLVGLVVVACAVEPPTFEELYRAGYRELEWGNLETATATAWKGLRLAREERRARWERAFEVLEAEILVAQRRIPEALEHLNDSLAEDRPVDVIRARALMTRGLAGCFSPDRENTYARADADLAQAADIAARLGTQKVAVEVVLRLGTCQILRGELDTAETSLREAMSLARRQGLRVIEAQAAGNLGNVRVRTRRFDDAVRWLRYSLNIVSDLPTEGLRAKNLINLGWCYMQLGDYERAVDTLSEAESLARRLGYAGDRFIALTNLGHTLRGQGDYAGARASYQRAATVAREINSPAQAAEMRALTQTTLATLSLEQGHYHEATSRAKAALEIQVEQGYDTAQQRTLLLLGQIWARRGEPARAAALYREVVRSAHSGPDLQWEARAALARLHVQADRPDEAEAEFRRAFALMEMSLSQILEGELQLPFFSSLRHFYSDYIDFLISRGDSLAALAVADRSRARLLRERLGGAGGEPRGERVYTRLARDLDAVLLFYWTAPQRSFLWLVHANGVELVTLPGREALQQLVTTYQERILQSRDPIGERWAEGVELYETLVAPASSLLPAAARLVVVPDGPLHPLNFETLVVPDPEPHYLIEDMVLVRAPSLRLLFVEGTPPRSKSPSVLVLGNPISPGDEFPPLPFAGREVASIAALFPAENRQIYSREQAKRSSYRNADLGRFTYIHFAAHAQANAVVPLESAVVLSAGDQDFKLYAREIVDIPLDAELVTLSACRSAGGRAFAGEGLVGLSWAFLSVGARHVIGGLWQVEDASTAELMTQLYRELVAGAEPAVALRRAKLQLLRSDTAYRKPYYWAPFVTYTSRAGSQAQMRSTASNRSAQESSSSASSGSSPSASEATAASARAPSKST